MPVEIEVVRNIYSEDNCADGAHFQVGPDCDILNTIRICTPDDASRGFWGAIDFNLSKEMATALAHAILAAVKDQTNS